MKIDVQSAKIIKLHEARVKRQNEFQKNENGIICPIYGIRQEISMKNPASIENFFANFKNKINDIMKNDLNSFWKMKSKSSILGYLAACRPGYSEWVNSGMDETKHPAIRIGWSFCRQTDSFNKDFGMLKAMECPRILNIQEAFGEYYIPEKDNDNIFVRFKYNMLPKSYDRPMEISFIQGEECQENDIVCVDYYPVTVKKQFERFIAKCEKYFLKCYQKH